MSLRYITSHRLAKRLLERDDSFITLSCDDREYIIEDFSFRPTHANLDDSIMHLNINLKEIENTKR